MKLCILVTTQKTLISFYLPMLQNLLAKGIEIIIIANDAHAPNHTLQQLQNRFGTIQFCQWQVQRGGMNPMADIKSFLQLLRLLKTLKPNALTAITLKPILYGGLAARFYQIPLLGQLIGLGYIFTGNNLLQRLVRLGLQLLLPFIYNVGNNRLLVLNRDDAILLRTKFFIKKQHVIESPGTGVDSNKFAPTKNLKSNLNRPQPIKILMMARLLYDKGVIDFCQVAELLKNSTTTNYQFLIAGAADEANPSSIPKAILKQWQKKSRSITAKKTTKQNREKILQFLGHQAQPEKIIKQADIVVLPSSREGLPQVLLEAAAAEKPLVAYDVAGVREICLHQKTGLLVPFKNLTALAHAITTLANDKKLRQQYGKAGRKLIQQQYDLTITTPKLVQQIMHLMQ